MTNQKAIHFFSSIVCTKSSANCNTSNGFKFDFMELNIFMYISLTNILLTNGRTLPGKTYNDEMGPLRRLEANPTTKDSSQIKHNSWNDKIPMSVKDGVEASIFKPNKVLQLNSVLLNKLFKNSNNIPKMNTQHAATSVAGPDIPYMVFDTMEVGRLKNRPKRSGACK